MQLRMEERELRARFGEAYVRYCRLVPRFVPRRTPVGHAEVYEVPRSNEFSTVESHLCT
jgi:hypothetical protein